MTFGVIPTGFNRKSLADILAEIQERNIAVFGPLVIQTAQSPLGQLNGVMSDIVAAEWELAEATYQSFDPDQAEGVRLDQLARFRILERAAGETDQTFRQAITNVNRARIDMSDLKTALEGLNGVTYVQVYVNEDSVADANGIPPNNVAVCVIGGDDDDIALTVRRYVVPGVGTYGNEILRTVIGGFCRQIRIVRPTEVPVEIEVKVLVHPDPTGCPPPSALAIATGLLGDLSGPNRPPNGQDGTEYVIRQPLEARYANIEVTEVKIAAVPASPTTPPLAIGFFQIMTFSIENITIIPV